MEKKTTIPLHAEEREILRELHTRFNEAFAIIARCRGMRGKSVRLSDDMTAMEVTEIVEDTTTLPLPSP